MKKILPLVFAIITLFMLAFLFLWQGSQKIELFHFVKSILFLESFTSQESIIVWDLRLPRIILAVTVGSALAVAGVCQQAIFKNPLAEPFILGISGGSALGAAIAIVLGYSSFIGFAAFLGGITTISIVKLLDAQFSYTRNVTHLLLAGIAISALANAFLSAIMSMFAQQMQAIFFWLMGSVAMPPDNYLVLCTIIIVGIIIIYTYSRELDIISLGDEQAFFLGVEVKKVRNIVLILSAVITSLSVSMSGTIGFIGLIVPHLLRNWIGASHFMLIPLAALWGGIILMSADALIRLSVVFSNLPIGVITALFGAPFFLYILWTKGRA